MRKFIAAGNFIFLVLFLLLLSSCKDNTVTPITYGNIHGVVLEPDSKTPIQGALITTNPGTQSIITDASGEFTLNNVPIGDYTVSASKTKFEKNSVSISVTTGNSAQVTIVLNYSTSTQPGMAVKPSPQNKSANQPVSLKLSWQPSSTSRFDTLKYDVYLYNSNSTTPVQIASSMTDTTYNVSNLKYGTTYFWQVITRGTDTVSTYGNIWSFSTRPFPDNPYVFARMVNGNYQIFSSDTTIANTVQLTSGNNRDWWPRFNPKHNIIAFTSDASVEPQIYTMNMDGSNLYQVTTIGVTGYGNYGTGFCWSPYGASLLFSHNDKLYRINSNGSNLTLIATAPAGRNFRGCSYSPDGSKIVVLTVGSNIYDSEIYLMNSDGSNMSLLVDNLSGATASPSFSVDGQKILFTHDVSGYQDNTGRELDSRIFEIDLATKDTTDLSAFKPKGTNDINPRYSPNGAYIIFENGSNTLNSTKNIWVMNSNISNVNAKGNNRQEIIVNGVMPDWK